jgi:peptidyl-dipeptidase A
MAHERADSGLVAVDQKKETTLHGSRIPMKQHPFQQFLQTFVPLVAKKSKDLNKAVWILETTGLADAADLKADLDADLRLLFNDAETYQRLLGWDQKREISDPLLRRQLNVLIRAFKQNQIPRELLEQMALKEAALAQSYANFRPTLQGQPVSENEIRNRMKNEENVEERKRIWAASKAIGDVLAPQILELVGLRNRAAKSLGYSDYFQMQLELQEVNSKWLLATLDRLGADSDQAYQKVLQEINKQLAARFGVDVAELGPWAWAEPFGQEDPLDSQALDDLVAAVDIPAACRHYYQQMGIDVEPILQRSDMYERPGKNQHAFCINIDRGSDIRTLNNVQQTIKWLETVLHELGHAIYEMGFAPDLPWLLREPPHMITTEAMALLAGRQAYRFRSLRTLVSVPAAAEPLLKAADESLRRRQLIFSRWVMVMTAFESELYRDPSQDLNHLWWSLVEKYQKISPPERREGKADWACKYHIGLAPVYYYSYLLGEMFASSIEAAIQKIAGPAGLESPRAGAFLNERLFALGNRMPWDELVHHVTGRPLDGSDWLREFAP